MSNYLQIGAFYHAGGYFSDVLPYGPSSFSTSQDEVFPAALLNTTEGGSGGTSAINWEIKLPLANPPQLLDGVSGRQEILGAKGNVLVFNPSQHPTMVQAYVSMPNYDLSDASHEESWGKLTDLVFNGSRIWCLTERFAFSGYIRSFPNVFLGARQTEIESCQFTAQYFYRAYHSGANKVYKLLAHGGA
jgi:hypothetical protein